MNNFEFNTINEEAEEEITEKKSRFIANIFCVNSKKEAEENIEKIRKRYYDAKHNCYAYSVLEDGCSYRKCSDDGEPSGTAGEPILNIITKNNLNNTLIVVTRYFGGILLGTGGLCRAYSEAALKVVEKSNIICKQSGIRIEITVSYEDNAIFRNYCEKNNIKIVNSDYAETIKYIVELNDEEYEKLTKAIISKNILKNTIEKDIREICRKYVEK